MNYRSSYSNGTGLPFFTVIPRTGHRSGLPLVPDLRGSMQANLLPEYMKYLTDRINLLSRQLSRRRSS